MKLILILAALMTLASCGKDGIDGKNGTNGTNGSDGAPGKDAPETDCHFFCYDKYLHVCCGGKPEIIVKASKCQPN
jgi:hypothetical protein